MDIDPESLESPDTHNHHASWGPAAQTMTESMMSSTHNIKKLAGDQDQGEAGEPELG